MLVSNDLVTEDKNPRDACAPWHPDCARSHEPKRNNAVKTNMKSISLLAAILGLGCSMLSEQAGAVPITGGISFFGSYTPQDSSAVMQPDLNNATQIAFGTTAVGFSGTSGSFTLIPDLTLVTMFSPLVFVPPTVPGPALWSVSAGGHTFSFTLSTLVNGGVTGSYPGAQSLTLSGVGTVSYAGAGGFDPTPGSWVGTFNAGGATFTWSSSTASLPDGGLTLALLGFALVGMEGLRRKLTS